MECAGQTSRSMEARPRNLQGLTGSAANILVPDTTVHLHGSSGLHVENDPQALVDVQDIFKRSSVNNKRFGFSISQGVVNVIEVSALIVSRKFLR